MEDENKKKKAIILGAILVAISLVLIAVFVYGCIYNNQEFAKIDDWSNQVTLGTLTPQQFQELYDPISPKLTAITAVSIVAIAGGVTCLAFGVICFRKPFKKNSED